MENILFVCQANVCRSPAAEYLFKRATADKQLNVRSAGVSPHTKLNIAPIMQGLLAEQNIDTTEHSPQAANEGLIRWADIVITMDDNQKSFLENKFLFSCGRIFLLGEWRDRLAIADPFIHDEPAYRRSLAQISECLEDWRERLWS